MSRPPTRHNVCPPGSGTGATDARDDEAAPSAPAVTRDAVDHPHLRVAFAEMLAAWSAGDAARYADLFSPDVVYVGFDGYAFRSRDQLRRSHDELFRGVLRGSRLVGEIDDIRAIGADVCVLHCRGAVVTRGRATPGRGRASVQTIVAVRHGDRWWFTDFHNTRYRPIPAIGRWFLRRSAAKHTPRG